jgi:hypothetical protein
VDLDSTLTRCEFEYSSLHSGRILDQDGDGIVDFYDPYNGDNSGFSSGNRRRSTANWLTIYPARSGNSCVVKPSGSVLFKCAHKIAGTEVYFGATVSRIIDEYGRELGRAIGVIVWYFDPKDGHYRSLKSIVFKERI